MRFLNTNGPGRCVAYLGIPALIFMAALSGCSTLESPGSASHAALTITGHSVAEVALMARTVFQEDGYTLSHVKTDRMIFDRPATKGEALKYGGWGGEDVIIRVKLDLQEMGDKKQLLRCDVFSVRDADKAAFEYETKLFLLSAKHYQKLLEEIQSRLDGGTTSETGNM